MFPKKILGIHAASLALAGLTAGPAAVTSAAAQSADLRALVAENFAQADANGDMILNATEFRTFIDLCAEDEIGRTAQVSRRGAYDRALSRLDANGDGSIDSNELAAVAGN